MFDDFSLISDSITEGESLQIRLTSPTAIPAGTTEYRWEIIPQGLLPVTFGADGDFMSRTGTATFTSTGSETQFDISVASLDNTRGGPTKDFAVRVYKVNSGADDELIGSDIAATLVDDDLDEGFVGRRDNLSGDGNNNILEFGGFQTVTADGFREDDLFVVSRFQYGDATIGDGFGTNTIRFDAGVEIINISEDSTDVRDDPTLQDAFGTGRPTIQDLLDNFIISDASEVITYNSVTYTLSTGGTVTIDAPATIVTPAAGETPAVLRYLFQIGNGEAKGYLDFREDFQVVDPDNPDGDLIDPTDANPFVIDSYGAVPDHPDNMPPARSLTNLSGEALDDILPLSGEFQTQADGFRGNDYFVVSRYLSGAMTIGDGFGTNTIRFDDGVRIVSVVEDSTDVRDDPTLQDAFGSGRPTIQDLLDNFIITDASEVITYNSVTYTLSTGGTVTIASPTTIVVPASGETPAVLRYLFQIGNGEAKGYLDFREDLRPTDATDPTTPSEANPFIVPFADGSTPDNRAMGSVTIRIDDTDNSGYANVGEVLTVITTGVSDADNTGGEDLDFTYQWSLDENLLSGETDAMITTDAVGTYSVVVISEDINGGMTEFTARQVVVPVNFVDTEAMATLTISIAQTDGNNDANVGEELSVAVTALVDADGSPVVTGFQWQVDTARDNTFVDVTTGGTNQALTATGEGHYRVVVSTRDGLDQTSTITSAYVNVMPVFVDTRAMGSVTISIAQTDSNSDANVGEVLMAVTNLTDADNGVGDSLILTYQWSFNDGTGAVDAGTERTQATNLLGAGTYSVVVTSEDINGGMTTHDPVSEAVVAAVDPVDPPDPGTPPATGQYYFQWDATDDFFQRYQDSDDTAAPISGTDAERFAGDNELRLGSTLDVDLTTGEDRVSGLSGNDIYRIETGLAQDVTITDAFVAGNGFNLIHLANGVDIASYSTPAIPGSSTPEVPGSGVAASLTLELVTGTDAGTSADITSTVTILAPEENFRFQLGDDAAVDYDAFVAILDML